MKYKKCYYGNKVEEHEIEFPDDIVFIYVNGSVGDSLYHGFNHYLGGTFKDFKEDSNVWTYKDFKDFTLIQLNNVIFESEISIISAEEFYNRFHFNDYYIFRYTKPDIIGEKIYYPRLISVSKILSVRSPYLIDTFSVSISSWILCNEDLEVKLINVTNNRKLSDIFSDFFGKVIVKKDCEEEFINVVNKVLSKVGLCTTNLQLK